MLLIIPFMPTKVAKKELLDKEKKSGDVDKEGCSILHQLTQGPCTYSVCNSGTNDVTNDVTLQGTSLFMQSLWLSLPCLPLEREPVFVGFRWYFSLTDLDMVIIILLDSQMCNLTSYIFSHKLHVTMKAAL